MKHRAHCWQIKYLKKKEIQDQFVDLVTLQDIPISEVCEVVVG